jgi:kumamolisin
MKKHESDSNQTYAVVEGSERVPLPGASVTSRANANATIEVTLKLRRKASLPDLKSRPATAITREELANLYGASKSDIDKVVHTFQKFGLKALEKNVATRSIRFAGTISEVEEAFQVKLFNYAHGNSNYRGRVGVIHVPSELKDIVQGVFGLDNRRVAKRRRQPVREAAHARILSVPSQWYTPSELGSHYNFPSGDGSGQTVGLLEFGGGYFADDLKKFCKLVGVAMPKVNPVSADGTATNSHDQAEGEVMLDVEVVAGLCPKANIVVYFAQWSEQGWISALDKSIHDNKNDPGVLSISWGSPEKADLWTRCAMTQVNESFKEAALLGITVCVAAGDDGSSDGVSDGHAHVDFPASSPYVLSVGGTTIPTKGNQSADITWKEGDGLREDNGGSTGGGVSAVFPRPEWQSAIAIASVNPGAIIGRCVPDVAANADWNASPYLLVVNGQAEPNGGTSAASPLWAALITLINAKRPRAQRAGFLTPTLYQTQGNGGTVGSMGCTDVLSGDNATDALGGYSAGPGYDAVSGWGTPNGGKLASALP